jgi:hypothetical protein
MPDTTARPSAEEIAKMHYKIPALVEHGIRCGKPSCTCATSAYRHGPYAYLYWRDVTGHVQRVYVRKAELPLVRDIIARRRAADRERRLALADARAYLRYLRQLAKEDGLW